MPAAIDPCKGLFARWQPKYAAHDIVVIPTTQARKPLVRNPQRFGLPASREIAKRKPDATAFGFYAGHRNKITVLDVDIADECVLADALSRHGQTPFVVRSQSGKFHAYYRHHGERRRIRPWRNEDLPIDVLGAGLCIAPPSITSKGSYQIIQGTLDDLDRLPVMAGLDAEFYHSSNSKSSDLEDRKSARIESGRRNDALYRHCMRQAHHADSFDALLAIANGFNMTQCHPPMPDDEVRTVALNAWDYTVEGRNWFGQRWVRFPANEAAELAVNHQDLAILLLFLRSQNGPDASFMIANGLAKRMGWTRKRLAAARHSLLAMGKIKQTRTAVYHDPAKFRWATPGNAEEHEGEGSS